MTTVEPVDLHTGRTRAELAAQVLHDGVLVHQVLHADGARLDGVRLSTAQLLAEQAEFLGRRPTGPVEWSAPQWIDTTAWHPERDRLWGSVARLPTEEIR